MEALKFEEFIMRNDEIMRQEMKEINHLIELREIPEEYRITDNTPSHLGLPERVHQPERVCLDIYGTDIHVFIDPLFETSGFKEHWMKGNSKSSPRNWHPALGIGEPTV